MPLGIVYRVVLVARPRVEHAFQADALGKATTIAQLFAVVAIVVHSGFAVPLAALACVLGLAASAHYVVRATHTAGAVS